MCLGPFQNQQNMIAFLQSTIVKTVRTGLKHWLLRKQDTLEPKVYTSCIQVWIKGALT